MFDLPPVVPVLPPAHVSYWRSSTEWIQELNGEPVFQEVGGLRVLVAIRWADDCAPQGFRQIQPGLFFPDESTSGQAWKLRMARTVPDPSPAQLGRK